MWGFHYLREGMSYEDALYDNLGFGGDTDTNACIIGGLLGAAQGLECLKDEWIEKVLNYDSTTHTSKGMRRPAYLQPKDYLIPLLGGLFLNAPDTLTIVPDLQ